MALMPPAPRTNIPKSSRTSRLPPTWNLPTKPAFQVPPRRVMTTSFLFPDMSTVSTPIWYAVTSGNSAIPVAEIACFSTTLVLEAQAVPPRRQPPLPMGITARLVSLNSPFPVLRATPGNLFGFAVATGRSRPRCGPREPGSPHGRLSRAASLMSHPSSLSKLIRATSLSGTLMFMLLLLKTTWSLPIPSPAV